MATDRKSKLGTLAQVAIDNSGVFGQAVLAFQYMLGWGMIEGADGKGTASVERYAECFEFDRATAYRHRAAFMKCFPGEDSPTRLNEKSGLQPVWAGYAKGLGSLADKYQRSKAAVFQAGAQSYPS